MIAAPGPASTSASAVARAGRAPSLVRRVFAQSWAALARRTGAPRFFAQTDPIRFKIVVPAFNCVPWIKKCLESIERQDYDHVEVCVIDDASTDPQQRVLIGEFCGRNGWDSVFNAVNRGALANAVLGFERLSPHDDDVLIILDGDDWLAHHSVLSRLAEYYEHDSPYITWGQYVEYPKSRRGLSSAVGRSVVKERRYRYHRWVFSHLRSFRYFLWRQIRDEDLRDDRGEYFREGWDLVIMFPMLEMAGGRVKFINEVMLVYNRDNPLNADKTDRVHLQRFAERVVRARPRYEAVLDGWCRIDTTPVREQLRSESRRRRRAVVQRLRRVAGRGLERASAKLPDRLRPLARRLRRLWK